MLKPIITAACLCAAAGAEAEAVRVSGQEITRLVAGATVEIETPIGTKLPIRYTADGKMSGQAGDLASYLGAATDTGRWWVESDQLCHKWSRWFSSEPQCLRLGKEGRTIHWRSQDGNSGTAVITVPAPVQVAAVPARAQVEPKAHVAAPVASAAPILAPPPAANPTPDANSAADEPLQAIEGKSVTVATMAAPMPVLATQASRARITSSPPVRAETNPPVLPVYFVSNVGQDDVLNVRSGPSTEFDVVGELRPGSRGVAITGACRSEWCPVQHQGTGGWVNRMYLSSNEPLSAMRDSRRVSSIEDLLAGDGARGHQPSLSDPSDAPRSCLTSSARALLERIEDRFGPVKLVSTCRPGATIAGTGRPSRHASGNAVDFDAGGRKTEIVDWLIANHHDGGTMTYSGMDHIHIDIGPHFVSIAGGPHRASWREAGRDYRSRTGRGSD